MCPWLPCGLGCSTVRAAPLLPSGGVGTASELLRPHPSHCGGLFLAGELRCSAATAAANRAELGLERGWATPLLLQAMPSTT